MSVFIGSIPNCTKEDINLAKKLLKKKQATCDSISLLNKEFSNLFNNRKFYLFNRGRDSLYFLLKSLKLTTHDEVILQGFTCISAVAPIIWCHATPVYTDIDKTTFNTNLKNLKKKITNNTRVILIQHTFGNIVDLKEIREYVNKLNKDRETPRKIIIIEDCAHLFRKDYKKYGIGEYSDAFFFSFAQDKSVSSTQGSIVIINKQRAFGERDTEYANVPNLEQKEALYNAKYIVLWNKIKKSYFKKVIPFIKSNITIGRCRIMLYRFLHMTKKQASADSIKYDGIHKMSDIQAELLFNQYHNLDNLNKHRETITAIYDTELKKELRFKKTNGSILLRYPLLIKNSNILKKKMLEREIITGRWYSSVVFPLERKDLRGVKYIKGDCKNAEEASRYIFNLPTNIEVTEEDAKYIVNVVNNFARQ